MGVWAGVYVCVWGGVGVWAGVCGEVWVCGQVCMCVCGEVWVCGQVCVHMCMYVEREHVDWCLCTISRGCAFVYCIPSKHARSNMEAFWLRPVTASYGPYGQPAGTLGQMVYARSNFLHQIRPGAYCAKPAWI